MSITLKKKKNHVKRGGEGKEEDFSRIKESDIVYQSICKSIF